MTLAPAPVNSSRLLPSSGDFDRERPPHQRRAGTPRMPWRSAAPAAPPRKLRGNPGRLEAAAIGASLLGKGEAIPRFSTAKPNHRERVQEQFLKCPSLRGRWVLRYRRVAVQREDPMPGRETKRRQFLAASGAGALALLGGAASAAAEWGGV
jgi:hypothetical protein